MAAPIIINNIDSFLIHVVKNNGAIARKKRVGVQSDFLEIEFFTISVALLVSSFNQLMAPSQIDSLRFFLVKDKQILSADAASPLCRDANRSTAALIAINVALKIIAALGVIRPLFELTYNM